MPLRCRAVQRSARLRRLVPHARTCHRRANSDEHSVRRLPPQAERIEPHTMPLTSVAATALDQPAARDSVAATMLQYLHTDSALCRAEPGPVAARQQEVRWG